MDIQIWKLAVWNCRKYVDLESLNFDVGKQTVVVRNTDTAMLTSSCHQQNRSMAPIYVYIGYMFLKRILEYRVIFYDIFSI